MCINPQASLDAGQQFDWYDGGGLDVAVLSFAQLDGAGNVNVGRFSGRAPGGGFINISQGAKLLVFVGTYVAGGKYIIGEDAAIPLPGGAPKLVNEVEQISSFADRAIEVGQPVTYVTERAVFQLTPDGLELTEIAPRLDLERDVLAHMGFVPKISAKLTQLDPSGYRDEPMNLLLQERVTP